jgi:hypothetical protein
VNEFVVPVSKYRRESSLPDLPGKLAANTVAAFSRAMKECYKGHMESLRADLSRTVWGDFFEPDPWDETVKSIERLHEARKEWPWPAVVRCN